MPAHSSPLFSQLAQAVLRLDHLLEELRVQTGQSGAPSPDTQPWFELLKSKLVPQLSEPACLIVAVMGGTNTGKSLFFNQLVGENFSAVDHHASGTKHPICLVPRHSETVDSEIEHADIQATLARHFDAFQLQCWSQPEQALEKCEQDYLFWHQSEHVPGRLWVLDTPDIDSDHEVNWVRARKIRDSADVVIAVLTREKYNDAAIRQFFREAAQSGKPLILLFNMLDLEEDLAALPGWLTQIQADTMCSAQNAAKKSVAPPLAILVAPHDRRAAHQQTVPVFAFEKSQLSSQPVSLAAILTELHFDTIKTQTLLGAIRVLQHPEQGVQGYLERVRQSSRQFRDALHLLENAGETSVPWPSLPSSILTREIRAWWHQGRPNWSKNVNGVYRRVGTAVLWPISKAAHLVKDHLFSHETKEPQKSFHEQENEAIVQFVSQVVGQLEKLAKTENPVLRREIAALVSGENRAQLLDRARNVLESLEPVDDSFRQILQNHLAQWAENHPKALGWLRSLDTMTTVARPVVTVTLAMSGFALGAQLATQVAAEAVIASGVTAGGEAAIHVGTETSAQQIAKLFGRIQQDFVLARSRRFYEEFRKDIWDDVIGRLKMGAAVTETDVFRQCENWTIQNINS